MRDDITQAQGYFLAVAMETTAALVKTLEILRQQGYWIDWWSRSEIEDELDNNPDLVKKYKSLFTCDYPI